MPPILSDYASQQRLQRIRPYLRGCILDLGCGFTTLPQVLETGQAYSGVDSWERALLYARQRYPQHTFHQRDLDHQPLNLGDERYDTIVMLAVLEHLHQPQQLLAQIHHLLAPQGQLVMTTPTPFGDWVHRLGSRLNLFYSEQHVAHVKIYGQAELVQLSQHNGFVVQHYHRFLFFTNQVIVCQAASLPGQD